MSNPSQRGWGTPPNPTVRVPCAGIPLNLDPRVAPLFAELIRRVEKIKGTGWMISAGGANVRPVRGYEAKYRATKNPDLLSNHSWGLAADFRAATNPQKLNAPSDMPGNMEQLCRDLSLTWGGTFAGARRDPMHVEFLGTPADAARAVAALNAPAPTATTKSTTTPRTASTEDDDMTPEQDERLKRIEQQLLGPDPAHPGWPQLGGRTPVEAQGRTLAIVEQLLVQVGARIDKAGTITWPGWVQLGGRTWTDALAAVGKKLSAWS